MVQQASLQTNSGAQPNTVTPQDSTQSTGQLQPTMANTATVPGSGQAAANADTVASTSQQPAVVEATAARPSTAPSPRKPTAVSSKAGVKGKVSADTPSFALGWFADSGEDSGEERLWLEEQMLVADGVKDKVSLYLYRFQDICGNLNCRFRPNPHPVSLCPSGLRGRS